MDRVSRHKLKNVVLACCVLFSVFLTGCAQMQSHETKVGASVTALNSSDPESAIAALDTNVKDTKEREGLLYNLEKGELSYVAKKYDQGIEHLLKADQIIKNWEEASKLNTNKLSAMAAAGLLSERLKAYEGQDYEKVMVSVRLAQARMASANLDEARVSIKRAHEREALIEELRIKETLEAEEKAKSSGATANTKVLDGYPVETLNDPEVLALKNGFQNAFGHYLSGYLYEALNEPSLAAAGYRKAIELRSGQTELEQALKGLDQRNSRYGKGNKTEVLLVLETGTAPIREERMFTLPVPSPTGITTVTIAYPVIQPSQNPPVINSVAFNSFNAVATPITNFNVMARRSLKDEMPGTMARIATRAVAKGVVQDQVASNLGWVGSLAAAFGSVATDGADDKLWRSLPEQISIARLSIPQGQYQIKVDGVEQLTPIEISGAYMVIPARLLNNKLLFGEPTHIGKLDGIETPPAPAQVKSPAPVKKGKAAKPAKKAKKKKST